MMTCAMRSTTRSRRLGSGTSASKTSPSCSTTSATLVGTQCAARGMDLPKIQAWMGHANIQTTMRYLHYVPAHDDAARLTVAFAAEVGTETGTELPTFPRN
jgi:integrase